MVIYPLWDWVLPRADDAGLSSFLGVCSCSFLALCAGMSSLTGSSVAPLGTRVPWFWSTLALVLLGDLQCWLQLPLIDLECAGTASLLTTLGLPICGILYARRLWSGLSLARSGPDPTLLCLCSDHSRVCMSIDHCVGLCTSLCLRRELGYRSTSCRWFAFVLRIAWGERFEFRFR